MAGKLMDALNVMAGRDLEAKKTTKKSSVKTKKASPAPAEEKKVKAEEPARKDRATDDAKFAAYDYAHNSADLSKDVLDALKEGTLSPDLEKLLQVLFDKAAVREIVASQGNVRAPEPTPEEYTLEYTFVNAETGADCTKAAEQLLEGGTKLDDLKTFNMKLRVVRKRKCDGSELSEGSEEDYEEIKKKIAEAKPAKAS